MGRRTVNGIKMNRELTEAERQAIRRAGDMDKQLIKAQELDVLDKEWYHKTLRMLKLISRDII